jgi:hypothetical protein
MKVKKEPAAIDIEQLFLAELRSRRKRLKALLRLVDMHVNGGRKPAAVPEARSRRKSRNSAASGHRTLGHARRKL